MMKGKTMNTETTETHELTGEFSIPTWRMKEFLSRFKKLEKICNSIDVAPPTYTSSDVYVRKVKTDRPGLYSDAVGLVEIDFIDIKVEYSQSIVLPGGWELFGVIDHRENIINTVPGKIIPQKYFGAPGYCDHCNTQRMRKETFIVQDENGESKQIGRQCLRKYLGIDGNRLFRVLEWFATIDEMSEYAPGERDGGNWIREYYRYDLTELLFVTAHWMKNHQYVSKANASERYNVRPTSGILYTLLNPPIYKEEREKFNRLKSELVELTPELTAEIETLIENVYTWLENYNVSNNQYMYNLKTLAENKCYTWKTLGYAASIIQSYNKNMGFLQERKARANEGVNNEHVGSKSECLELEVKVISTKPYETTTWNGYHANGTIYNFADSAGHRFVWFTLNPLDFGDENTYRKVKAIVKNHTEFNGVKQTQINRVTLQKK